MRSLWIYLLVILGAALIYQSHPRAGRAHPLRALPAISPSGAARRGGDPGDTYVARAAPDRARAPRSTYAPGGSRTVSTICSPASTSARCPTPWSPTTTGSSRPRCSGCSRSAATILILALSTRKGAAPTLTNPALSFGKNKARLYVDKGAPVTFGDVAGSEEAKAELAEVVEFLKAPERYRKLGARVPRGVVKKLRELPFVIDAPRDHAKGGRGLAFQPAGSGSISSGSRQTNRPSGVAFIRCLASNHAR